jgi:transcriptional regulator with XRE-family HTH domain
MTNNPTPDAVPVFTLGDRLRKARNVADMTIPDMAAVLGVTEKTVRNYESETTPMKRATLIAWAMSTGTPFEWLETGRTPDTPTSRCNGALRWQPYPPPRIAA